MERVNQKIDDVINARNMIGRQDQATDVKQITRDKQGIQIGRKFVRRTAR